MEFFATAADAVAAGYRACRRCRPDHATVTDPAVATVIAVCRRIENPDDDPDMAELAASVGWSQRHLARLFKRVTGVTISAYRRAARAERVRDALRRGAPVTEAVFDAGYGSMRAFYDHGATQLGSIAGDLPSRFAGGGGAIHHDRHPDRGGRCGCDRAGSLRGEDRRRRAVGGRRDRGGVPERDAVDRDDDGLADVAVAVGALAAGRSPSMANIPLDLQGTAFQVSVWEALRAIEPGSTVTYGELAEAIGRPTAHRAVAGACAANPAALVVPCHRAVRADGSVGGYRWGPERKSALLAAEAEVAADPAR